MKNQLDIAIFDFDKTIFQHDSIVGICDFMKNTQHLNMDLWSKEYKLHVNNEANAILKKLKVAEFFQGKSKKEIQELFFEYARFNKNAYFHEVYYEFLKAKEEGCLTICLSASFEILVYELLKGMNISFDIIAGTRLEFEDGVCTGNIDGLNLSGFNKFIWLKNWIQLRDASDVIVKKCYTDHISDSLILLLSEQRFVVKSKKAFDDWSHLIEGVKYILV